MKDPAFPFYAQDFLVSTMHLTFQETGAYIKLLSYQWVNKSIPKNRLGFILGNEWETIWPAISTMFSETNGLLFNERLETERKKRTEFKQKQSENGKKGGRPKKAQFLINQTENTLKENPTKSQKKPLENENENESIIEYEKGKEGMGEKPTVLLPYISAEFATQWQLWKSYRHKEHRQNYHSPESEQAALAELNSLAQGQQTTAIAILHQSMGKGWKGLFELKPLCNAGKPPAGKSKVKYSDDFKRKIAQRLQSG